MPTKKPPNIAKMLFDPKTPLPLRKQFIAQLCMGGGKETDQILTTLLDKAVANNTEDNLKETLEEYTQLLEAMKEGPIRGGTFHSRVLTETSIIRARVLLADGSEVYPVIPEAVMSEKMKRGDRVWVEAQGKAVLFHDPGCESVGEVAEFTRHLPDGTAEVRLNDRGNYSYWVSEQLSREIESGEANPGDSVLVCPQRMMAFSRIPAEDGLSHFKHLVKDPVPNVVVERDIGSPPRYIGQLSQHLRTEMTEPEIARKYRLRPSRTILLTGVSGAGKTLSMQGMWRRCYEIMSEVTGVPIDKLPPRVLRLRISDILSKWVGQSDKAIDRFFDEVEQLSELEFVTEDGRKFILPVLVLCEEIDGLARERGQDSIHDRIQVTLLERLDATSQKLRDKLILFLFSTNVPHLVDPAFLRRAGGVVERFGRLSRRGFNAVLEKNLRDLPVRKTSKPLSKSSGNRSLVSEVSGWLFSPNGEDQGQVEITFVGTSQPLIQYRRDMLTGGLVDRAVQQASAVACRLEQAGYHRPGMTSSLLMRAIDDQVRNTVEQMKPHNAGNYLTLPEGMRVSDVRKLDQPAMLPSEFEHSMTS